jgi:hypothetical protein
MEQNKQLQLNIKIIKNKTEIEPKVHSLELGKPLFFLCSF